MEELDLQDPNWLQTDALEESARSDQNLVDLSDATCPDAFELLWDRVVLDRTEIWERGIETGQDTPGYPSVVQNMYGENPDGKFYLYYAIHDPYSGIGVAVADRIDGEFRKLAQLRPWRSDSRVLRAPKHPRPTSHFSSPIVLWNPVEEKWFLFFHFFADEWSEGRGHQKTGLAITTSLSSHKWDVQTDEQGRLLAVIPTTAERWMNSQSSYHSIHRLSNGTWLAFLRGVGGAYETPAQWRQDAARLGFAVSRDGRRWAQLPGNPAIQQPNGRYGREGVYRPFFVARAGAGYLLGWGESDYYDTDSRLALGMTQDFETIRLLEKNLFELDVADGAISLWRQNGVLYAFYGRRQRAWNIRGDNCAASTAER
jgi:hypothetical protein